MTLVEKRSKRTQMVAYALIGIMLAAMGYGVGVWSAPVTSFGIDGSGNLKVNSLDVNDYKYQGTSIETDSLLYPEEIASYVVWVDGATYYARNGHTGAVTSNANFYTLTNAIFTACTGGETILIKNGAYALDTTWTITKPLNIVGEGKNTVITFSGTTTAILYDAATQSIRDGSLRNLMISAADLIAITITSDAGHVFSQSIIDNIMIDNCSKGLYISYNGSTTYKNYFSKLIILNISSFGVHTLGGSYNSFEDIEITQVENNAYAIGSATSLSKWVNISCDGLIDDSGYSSLWENTAIEGITATPPAAPNSAAFRLSGVGTCINGLTLTEVDNAKCNYGLSIYNLGHTINGFVVLGTSRPDYPLSLDSSSGGVINGANKVGGYGLASLGTIGSFSKWTINSGNIIDSEGVSSVKLHRLHTQTLGAGATTIALSSDVAVLTGDGAGNTLATITGGILGQILYIIFTDALITVTDTDAHTADTVDLSAAFVSADDKILALLYDGVSWYEVSRSVN
jgi:hypothetical protein